MAMCACVRVRLMRLLVWTRLANVIFGICKLHSISFWLSVNRVQNAVHIADDAYEFALSF